MTDTTLSLERFDPTREALTQMVEETKGITAIDLKDKAQLTAVKNARIGFKNARVRIEKRGKELRADAIKFQRDVIAKEKELIAIIEPEEDRLKAIEHEAEQMRIREERIELLPSRKEKLARLEDGVEVDDETLLGMDGPTFQGYINQRLSEKNERDRAEIERQKEEQKKEQERLDNEKNAREREDKAREEERERIQREQQAEEDRKKRQAEEEKKAKLDKRVRDIASLGLLYSESDAGYKLEDFYIPTLDIQTKDDGEWALLIEKIRTEIKRRDDEAKAQEEKEKIEREEKYQAWRTELGWTEETRQDYKEEKAGEVVTLWKKIGTFKINE